jgi:hypothetical protein
LYLDGYYLVSCELPLWIMCNAQAEHFSSPRLSATPPLGPWDGAVTTHQRKALAGVAAGHSAPIMARVFDA